MVDKGTDDDFIENNQGKVKLCPGRPAYILKGIEVPCFIWCTKKGRMTSTIIKEALETLDRLELFLIEVVFS